MMTRASLGLMFAVLLTAACSTPAALPTAPPLAPPALDRQRPDSLPCRVWLREVPDPRGNDDSRVWVRAEVGDCVTGTAITWSVSGVAHIEDWHRDKDDRLAWVAGPSGAYLVTAQLRAGVVGTLPITIEP